MSVTASAYTTFAITIADTFLSFKRNNAVKSSRSTSPSFYEKHFGFFYVPQESEQWKRCTRETRPKVYRPYPRRFKQEAMYGLPTETKEVAVVEKV